jgi:hypothetical protein
MDQAEQVMQTARGLRTHWLTSITPHGRQAIHGISPRLVALLDELERRMDPARRRIAASGDEVDPNTELMNSSAREVIALVAEKTPPSVADLAAQIREQDDALDELVMAAELVFTYRDDRAFGRLGEALTAWREASGDPR